MLRTLVRLLLGDGCATWFTKLLGSDTLSYGGVILVSLLSVELIGCD